VQGFFVLLTLAAGPVGPATPAGTPAVVHREPAFQPPGPALPRGATVPDHAHDEARPGPVGPALPPGSPDGHTDALPFLAPAVAGLALVALLVRRRRLQSSAS
jgi:hypothetical protein